MRSFVSLLFLAASVSATKGKSSSNACSQLKSQFPSLISFPNSTIYETENSGFWSETTILSPDCIFTPDSAQDVSAAVKILVETNTHFAVLGGGHMPIPGAASTSDGVLIAMNQLDGVTLTTVEGQKMAQLGAGGRWIDTYDILAAQNLTVIGGRYAPVGVGGYFLGGGVSYYLGARGWAVNHVFNYEIVAADGEIMQVNATSYPDLFWALKGGSNNFGIATRFDVEIFPLVEIYGGFPESKIDPVYVDDVVQALADYISPPTGGIFDESSAIALTLEWTTDTRELVPVTNLFYNGSIASPKAFENFTAIPLAAGGIQADVQSLMTYLNSTTIDGDRNSNKLFGATSLKGTPEAVHIFSRVFQEEVHKLRNISGGIVNMAYQPFPVSALEAAVALGGDAISLKPEDGAILTVVVSVLFPDASDTEYFKAWVNNLHSRIEQEGEAVGQDYPFVYLNDAAEGQKPFPLYGNGSSLPVMRRTAKKYDPNGVFQTLLAGAFKLW